MESLTTLSPPSSDNSPMSFPFPTTSVPLTLSQTVDSPGKCPSTPELMRSLSPLTLEELQMIDDITPEQEVRLLASPSRPQPITETSNNINSNNIRKHLSVLKSHRDNSTLPKGLKFEIKPQCALPPDLQHKWDSTILGASTKLCNILITNYERILGVDENDQGIPSLMSLEPVPPQPSFLVGRRGHPTRRSLRFQ